MEENGRFTDEGYVRATGDRWTRMYDGSRDDIPDEYLSLIHIFNDIMNNAVTGWRAFSNPRYFPEPYRRQKGWERIRNDNEPDNSMDGFQ